MDDLGDHAIFVLRGDESAYCEVGIESTVLKLDEASRKLLLLRRGGVPEAILSRWAERDPSGYTFTVQVAHKVPSHSPQPATLPTIEPPAAGDGPTTGDADDADAPLMAPGTLLTHYAPDVPSYLLVPPEADIMSAVADGAEWEESGGASEGPDAMSHLSRSVVLDFGSRLAVLKDGAFAYRDLSPTADASQAASLLFEALRWAEARGKAGGECVLLPDVMASSDPAEDLPALADRLFRAASGQRARLAAGGAVRQAAE